MWNSLKEFLKGHDILVMTNSKFNPGDSSAEIPPSFCPLNQQQTSFLWKHGHLDRSY